jgi:hypothetical protein
MRRSRLFRHWYRETVKRAISILGLIRITRAGREVELRSPARQCPECHEMVDVVVLPASVCATCWSRKVNWGVADHAAEWSGSGDCGGDGASGG